ncbi:ABC transporter permease subunit [Actinoallomurus iriomotensis]|uniref:Transporter n=1 Tax=Actinoallomurus iriomotensis TaxID=478107 RepID=A0A9W6S8T1_9ACTN|nr:ABC transporter permease subunit [Actinoallomurus iriomotensis]GLY89464.1 transporter [Actinoallomurus iriomotensis]
MIWLTWRQHRFQAFAGLALIGLTALVFLPYGLAIRDAYAQHGVGSCLVQGTGGDGCQSAMTTFMEQFNGVANHLLTWFTPIPGLIGAIVGASLLGREYEHGTWRLAWTQAVPRTRWLTAKLLLVGLGLAVITASLSGVFGWFRGPVDSVSGRFSPGAFDLEGLSLTGYTLFAFAAGVLAGLVFRRTVPAIVAAFAAFMAVRLPVEYWLRQRYETPVTRLLPPAGNWGRIGPMAVPTSPGTPGWILDQGLVDRAGHPVSAALQAQISQRTQSLNGPAADAYLRGLGLHLRVVYQPASRFWTFQIIEASLFVGLAAALLGATVWLLRRRRA